MTTPPRVIGEQRVLLRKAENAAVECAHWLERLEGSADGEALRLVQAALVQAGFLQSDIRRALDAVPVFEEISDGRTFEGSE